MNFKLFITLNVIALIACDQIVVNHSLDGDQISKRFQRKGKKHQRKDVKTKKKERWVVDSVSKILCYIFWRKRNGIYFYNSCPLSTNGVDYIGLSVA